MRLSRTSVLLGFCLLVWLGLTGDSTLTSRLVSYDEFSGDVECVRPQYADPSSLMAAEPWSARDASQRKPERMIQDPYAAYSAVAVDPNHDEVVLTDENPFRIWVYDRNAKTSPNKSSDPKRLIGGLNTKIEFQCGLYIDPANGDIYAVNNDTIDTLVIFSRQAIGDVKPGERVLARSQATGEYAFEPVIQVFRYQDPVNVYLTLEDPTTGSTEIIETTP